MGRRMGDGAAGSAPRLVKLHDSINRGVNDDDGRMVDTSSVIRRDADHDIMIAHTDGT